MDTRITKSLVAAALTLPLLAGCSGGSESAAPAGSSAPTSSAAAPSSSSAVSPAASPSSASPTPTSDPAADQKDVQDASEEFVKALLTIGYPDKNLDDYAARVRPLTTKSGYASLFEGDSRKSAARVVKKLSTEKSRTVPKLLGDTKVSALTEDSATTKIRYSAQLQQREGDGWKVVKTLDKQTTTITLVKDDGKWLVEEAG